MPCHSAIGQSKSLFLLTVALLCFQAKKLPFSHGNGHSDWLTEWLFLYNYRIIYRLANTKDLRFSTKWCIIILCNTANYPVSQVLNTQLMHQSIPSTNIPPPSPGDPRDFALYGCPGAGIYTWWPSPGAGFLHIHKITFTTVKSILSLNWHLDHTSMRFIGSSDLRPGETDQHC